VINGRVPKELDELLQSLVILFTINTHRCRTRGDGDAATELVFDLDFQVGR